MSLKHREQRDSRGSTCVPRSPVEVLGQVSPSVTMDAQLGNIRQFDCAEFPYLEAPAS